MEATFFSKNRERFLKQMENESVLILDSNEILYGNEDEVLPFVQSNDFIYLTGISQAKSKLILYKNSNSQGGDEADKCLLFLETSTKEKEIWDGKKLSFTQAEQISGIASIRDLEEFETTCLTLVPSIKHIYLNSNENIRRSLSSGLSLRGAGGGDYHSQKIIEKIKQAFPLHSYKRANLIFRSLRSVKTEQEINQIRKAINITKKSLLKIIPLLKAGTKERDIERELAYLMSRESQQSIQNIFAFDPIVASGVNACTLHYTKNSGVLEKGNLVLLDVGVRLGFYNSDISRVFPVAFPSTAANKHSLFSARQRELYSALLQAQKKIIKLIKPGLSFKLYNEKARKIMQDSLIQVGLIKKAMDYRKYFMHGVSHSLGLGVHDLFDYNSVMQEGMVITCEPGVYIPEEKIGLRLEDDILITKSGSENLSAAIPKELDEIAELFF